MLARRWLLPRVSSAELQGHMRPLGISAMMKQDPALARGSRRVTQPPWGWAPGVLSSGISRVVLCRAG